MFKSTRVTTALAILCLLAAMPWASRAQTGTRASQAVSRQKVITGARLGALKLAQAANLTSLCALEGRIFGAGKGQVLIIGDAGQVLRTIPTTVDTPTISPHRAGTLILGDCGRKVLYELNVQTGRMTELLSLAEVRDSAVGQAPDSALLRTRSFLSVASDGENAYVALGAGFSSAIFKIELRSRQVVARSFAPSDDPSAMAFFDGALHVLVGRGRRVRKFTAGLEPSLDVIDLRQEGGRGLAIRAGEVGVISTRESAILRYRVEATAIGGASLARSLDRVTARLPAAAVSQGLRPLVAQKYAVLICGDLAENFEGECFWNDTVWMFKTLLNNGYTEANIFVLYGDGADFASASPKYQFPRTVTDFPATRAWVIKVLEGLASGDATNHIPAMGGMDTLFVWTFDHGSGGEAAWLCLRGVDISDTDFAAKINAIPYRRRAIFMQQCRSGGFIGELRNATTFISTAARATEDAHPADTENEIYGGRYYSHGEYNYYLMSALDRVTPTGSAVNADTNGNARIAALEAHNWIVGHENRSETPQMDDSGGVGSVFEFTKSPPAAPANVTIK
jgi:hypothetical protein